MGEIRRGAGCAHRSAPRDTVSPCRTLPSPTTRSVPSRSGSSAEHNATVDLVEYDPEWPRLFEREAAANPRSARRPGAPDRARRLDLGAGARRPSRSSTSTSSSPTPPTRTRTFPTLEAAGYVLRDPRARLVRAPAASRAGSATCNVHVFSAGCEEVERMLAFRDWLRTHDDDRELYERTKRELAAQRVEVRPELRRREVGRRRGDRRPRTGHVAAATATRGCSTR